jgi:isopenicillin-N N-acyltransferase-like protein
VTGRRRVLVALLALAAAVPLAHGAVTLTTPIDPPGTSSARATTSMETTVDARGTSHVGKGYARRREGLREVYLEGSPTEFGTEHARLLRQSMLENEQELWDSFAHLVPFAPARTLIMDVSRVRYHHVDRGMPAERLAEVAAGARAFDPDPYASHLPTYHRMVFLHALYDIALSFEHSPLIGCSAFVLGPEATADGHTLLARAFDFEAGDVFDRDKAVFFVRGEGDGVLPFASVAWPGLVGVLSGMNVEGVAIVVNGGRARDPETTGMPVVFALREVLERAHDTAEAIAILGAQQVMVSHIVMVTDAHGKTAIVERAPGVPAFVRDAFADPDRVAVTNHFEGPLASDPRNEVVRRTSTTLPRRARADELLSAVGPHQGSVPRAVAMLRDHACAGGVPCELGDRRAIDALIATHGIVADTTDRVLWVSAGPHLSGKFVRFDLRAIFAKDHDPARDPEPETLPEDPILADGRYAAGRVHAGGPRFGGDAR